MTEQEKEERELGRDKVRGRASFLFPKSIFPFIGAMTDEYAGKFIKQALYYVVNFEVPESTNNLMIDTTFKAFKDEYDRETKKYIEVCKSNAVNGAKGGRSRAESNK